MKLVLVEYEKNLRPLTPKEKEELELKLSADKYNL